MNLNPVPRFFLFLFLIGLFSFCSVRKRHYTKGYYVSWKKPSVQRTTAQAIPVLGNATRPVVETTKQALVPLQKDDTQQATLFASAEQQGRPLSLLIKKHPLVFEGDTCGDKIVFRNGNEQVVKIVDVTDDLISFRPCDYLDGPIRKISTNDVFMVKYASGLKRVFSTTTSHAGVSSEPAKRTVPRKQNVLAKISYILSYFTWFWFIPGIASVILGSIALKQIEDNPDKYSNKWKAIAGITISCAISLILILFIFFA